MPFGPACAGWCFLYNSLADFLLLSVVRLGSRRSRSLGGQKNFYQWPYSKINATSFYSHYLDEPEIKTIFESLIVWIYAELREGFSLIFYIRNT